MTTVRALDPSDFSEASAAQAVSCGNIAATAAKKTMKVIWISFDLCIATLPLSHHYNIHSMICPVKKRPECVQKMKIPDNITGRYKIYYRNR